ncbi:MAG: nitrite/sulfite reductase, partial [Gemmatimonadetes bacterium]|nr:nitrite/sulfite reductase [Gemmatimonadota bacterium]NIU53245.1 nitrite/sulfite reductase [Gemmatimonadota bacterium]NIY44971.1 nitrite/sulfite reductase [Gemmatimonadota bacterium]
RIKFLVAKLGIEEFRELVAEERAQLRPDPRWTDFLEELRGPDETPVRDPAPLPDEGPERFRQWAKTNLRAQSQEGYYVATLTLPLGDISSEQGWILADLARKYTGDSIRCTVEQNLAFRWLSGADALAFWEALETIGLGEPGASTIT